QLPPTQGGAHAFTPDYASPEQVRGLPVATSSDLYSLGVIACELLTGRRPFAFDGHLFAEMQQVISEVPAPAPSSLVTAAHAVTFGEKEPARLRRRLAGDLDAIILQALRKEPARRYHSAEQLGEDFRRHLDGLPVSARRDATGYRLGKFVRRRRVEVTGGIIAVAALIGGVVATTRQARVAELERAKVQQVNAFLSRMLAAVDPGNSGRNVTVAQVLSQAAKDIEGQHLAPEVEAQIRHTIGQTYTELALYDSARVHVERAVALRETEYGELDQRTSMSLSYLAALEEARGNLAEAEAIARRIVDIQSRIAPRANAELATAYDNLGRYIENQGRLDEALDFQLKSLAIRRVSSDSASADALPYSLVNLSVSYLYKGEIARAESLSRESLEAEARVRGRTSANYGAALRQLATVLDFAKHPEAADTAIRQSVEILRQAVGTSHQEYLRSVSQLAVLRASVNDWPAVEAAAREVVGHIGGALHPSHPQAAVALQNLGFALAERGADAAADSAFRRSLALRREYLPADHWAIASSESVLGHHLAMTGHVAEGEPMLRRAYRKLVAARGADASPTRSTAERIAEVLEKTGRAEEARGWRR
ncbi:MAG: tetratricopeptide repeat protein, partial [Gemmatimonadaceae bacterium]|nr:tetratricopeptide repeat protein [Gemmatimonadaceae bacterium]